jgi:hypothetical protein
MQAIQGHHPLILASAKPLSGTAAGNSRDVLSQ